MNIGTIVWPESVKDAVRQYLRFQILVLNELQIGLPQEPNDSVALVQKWLKGFISDAALDDAKVEWWSLLDSSDAITNFQSRSTLHARMALCLLSVRDDDAPNLGEHLSWFFEVLGFYGADIQKANALMQRCFNFLPTAR